VKRLVQGLAGVSSHPVTGCREIAGGVAGLHQMGQHLCVFVFADAA
jgi:hypothetical protein